MSHEADPTAPLGPPVVESDDRALGAFLDRHFDGVPGVCEEFPLLVGESNRARRLVLRDADGIAAHAAWKPLELRTSAGPIAAAGIGLVATRPDWRERGLASALVHACVEQARESGAELALLFGESRGLYRRLGFVPAGRERVTRLERAATSDAGKVRVGGPGDAAALLPLYDSHPLGVRRTLDEFRALLAIPGVSLWWLEEGGRPAAYCVEGKGRDLTGVLHEWAGDASALRGLVAAVLDAHDDVQFLLSPASFAAPVAGAHSIGPLAQMRILAPGRFATADPRIAFGEPGSAGRIEAYLWGLDSL